MGPQWRRVPVSKAFLYIFFRALSKGALSPGSPRTVPIERDALCQEPSFVHLSNSPVNEPPTGSPAGPLWREIPISRDFIYISYTVPRQGTPFRFSTESSHRKRERDSLFPELFFI